MIREHAAYVYSTKSYAVLGVLNLILSLGVLCCGLATLVFAPQVSWFCNGVTIRPANSPDYSFYNCTLDDGIMWTYTAQGVWGGFIMFVAAGVSIGMSRHPTPSLSSANVGVNLTAFLVAAVVIVLEILAILDCDYTGTAYNTTEQTDAGDVLYGLHLAILITTSVILIFMAIVWIVGCCDNHCKKQPVEINPTPVYYNRQSGDVNVPYEPRVK